ncbi:hypothetical protein GBAR_LOCUS12274 [Geodia barretti]|uniref:Uncharacterized protein n=1 Tax=Geodia barretti TaxID=519541 RepID=A0AA35RZ98_GEOBA|nr:hypothetical protein GBAR_LOCUS12274 [Geodia barretti]
MWRDDWKKEERRERRCEMEKDVTLPASSVPTETVHEEETAAQNEKEEENETRSEAEDCEMEEDVPLAKSDTLYEGDRGIAKSVRVCDRRLTYSISPEPSATLSRLPGNDPVLSPPDNVVATPTSGSRKRRRTHSISPSSSLLQSGTISLDTATASVGTAPLALGEISSEEKMCGGGSATDQIMALLDQRVADRKAEPGYVAPSTSVSSLIETHRQAGSLIPFAKTTEKANRAHERLFSKMPSILEYSDKKRRRRVAAQTSATPGPPAKRQKVAAKTPRTPYEPLRKSVKPSTNPKVRMSGVRGSGSVSAMKPSAKPNFNFSKTSTGRPEKPAAVAATHAIASTKTNEKSECHAFVFSAKQPQIRKPPIKKAHR